MIIDTHLHLIYRDRLSYPWLKDVPALDADFTGRPIRGRRVGSGSPRCCIWKWMSRLRTFPRKPRWSRTCPAP